MPEHDHHRKPYDSGTSDKLFLYRNYLREWLPVFLNKADIETIHVFDFFAGPGCDSDGKAGSPVIACEELTNALLTHGDKPHAPVQLFFNEFHTHKYNLLTKRLALFDPLPSRVEIVHCNLDFKEAFASWLPIMTKPGVANLLFFDQNGVKFVSPEVFKRVIDIPKTDFMFFISSSTVNRFKEEPEIRRFVPVSDNDCARMNGTNVHRLVAESYRRLIPKGRTYYLSPFSIRKNANMYGLIFGSAHPLGVDKFQKQCWKLDKIWGESNCGDLDGEGIDSQQPSLWAEMDKPNKLKMFEQELAAAITRRKVQTNKDVYLFSLEFGVLPEHAKTAFKHMMEEGRLPRQKMPNISYDAWKPQNPAQMIQLFPKATP